MSDTSQGPGWWRASDGNWYPPEEVTEAGWWKASDGNWYPPPQPAESAPGMEEAGAQIRPTVWPIMGGAAAMILGSFLPWVSVSTGFGTISKAGTDGGSDGWFTLIAGIIVIAVAWPLATRRTGVRIGRPIAVTVLGVIGGAICAWDFVDILSIGNDLVSASPGVGLVLSGLGSAAVTVGGIIEIGKARTQGGT